MVLCSVWRCRPRLCRAPVPLIGPGEGKISKSTLRGTQWDSTPYSIPQRPHTGRGSVLVVAAVFVESLPGPGVDLREAQPGLLLTAEREDVLRHGAGAETQKSVSLSLSLSLSLDIKQHASPLVLPSDAGHGDAGGVQMFRAEEHQANPAQVKQFDLVIVIPVYLDNSNLAEHGKTASCLTAVTYLSQVFVGENWILVNLRMEELDTLSAGTNNTCKKRTK